MDNTFQRVFLAGKARASLQALWVRAEQKSGKSCAWVSNRQNPGREYGDGVDRCIHESVTIKGVTITVTVQKEVRSKRDGQEEPSGKHLWNPFHLGNVRPGLRNICYSLDAKTGKKEKNQAQHSCYNLRCLTVGIFLWTHVEKPESDFIYGYLKSRDS